MSEDRCGFVYEDGMVCGDLFCKSDHDFDGFSHPFQPSQSSAPKSAEDSQSNDTEQPEATDNSSRWKATMGLPSMPIRSGIQPGLGSSPHVHTRVSQRPVGSENVDWPLYILSMVVGE